MIHILMISLPFILMKLSRGTYKPSLVHQKLFSQYLEDVSAKSLYDYEIEVTESDQILTLVTCSYDIDDGRYFYSCKEAMISARYLQCTYYDV